MIKVTLSTILTVSSLLIAAPSFAQDSPASQKQHTGNDNSAAEPASGASKQQTSGRSAMIAGPSSGVTKQHTESLTNADGSPADATKKK